MRIRACVVLSQLFNFARLSGRRQSLETWPVATVTAGHLTVWWLFPGQGKHLALERHRKLSTRGDAL